MFEDRTWISVPGDACKKQGQSNLGEHGKVAFGVSRIRIEKDCAEAISRDRESVDDA